jgi:hypothetical protein
MGDDQHADPTGIAETQLSRVNDDVAGQTAHRIQNLHQTVAGIQVQLAAHSDPHATGSLVDRDVERWWSWARLRCEH